MTVLPFLDIKSTPINAVESPRWKTRAQSLPKIRNSSDELNVCEESTKTSSIFSGRARTPKIKIYPRTDRYLKDLPTKKSSQAESFNYIWKPLIRQPVDYDYLWEPVQREDIRHQYDFYVAPHRIVASRPDEPYRMTTMFETEDRHDHNYRRARAMQRRQWNREHIQYTTYPYAETEEREIYNKKIRSTLKEQIEEKHHADKLDQQIKAIEIQTLIERDRQDLEQIKEQRIEKTRKLLGATSKNKELMENKWEFDQWNRFHQWHVDRAILADDPINWSKTLT